jgi:hypothetical protein
MIFWISRIMDYSKDSRPFVTARLKSISVYAPYLPPLVLEGLANCDSRKWATMRSKNKETLLYK